jgi:alkanesulfonate monooxygenase SsuD/methylene tetrahydromethanopterin reductase-like flavin-dependent oxidoreductase (luciferase family)
MIGVSMWREPSIPRLVEQIVEAERIGVPAVWLPSGRSAPDALSVLAAAALKTATVRLGVAVLPIWGRHPASAAEAALVVAALAPGRLRLGVGASIPATATTFGTEIRAPLQHLREYGFILRTLLHTGQVEFEGTYFRAHAQLPTPVDVPVLTAALRSGAYRVAGEVADGVISSLAPWPYIQSACLPRLREGAAAAGREPPSVILNVLVCPTADGDAVRAATREQFNGYTQIPVYAALFRAAQFDFAERLPDQFVDELVVWGERRDLIDGLRAKLALPGVGELRVIPVLVGDDSGASRQLVMEAVAMANG